MFSDVGDTVKRLTLESKNEDWTEIILIYQNARLMTTIEFAKVNHDKDDSYQVFKRVFVDRFSAEMKIDEPIRYGERITNTRNIPRDGIALTGDKYLVFALNEDEIYGIIADII